MCIHEMHAQKHKCLCFRTLICSCQSHSKCWLHKPWHIAWQAVLSFKLLDLWTQIKSLQLRPTKPVRFHTLEKRFCNPGEARMGQELCRFCQPAGLLQRSAQMDSSTPAHTAMAAWRGACHTPERPWDFTRPAARTPVSH